MNRISALWRGWGLAAVLGIVALLQAAVPARGEVSLLLEMPYGQMGAFNPTGHAALYFDHICAATPVSLRSCRPGELGVVISRYDGVGGYDWVAVPLVPYLYGVESAATIPASVDRLSALRIRDLYRREHLEAVAPDTAAGGMPQGNWYELAGSAFDRTIYGFGVKTTAEQDRELMDYFNDRPNVSHYVGVYRNCADFTRVVLNQLFPHAVRRNYVADFGATTPKSVARSLVHYARKRPELELRMFRVPQLSGSMPRSVSIQGISGSLLSRYGVPMAILSPHVTAVVLVAYVGKGRFAVPKNAPLLDFAAMARAAHVGSADSGRTVALGGEAAVGVEMGSETIADEVMAGVSGPLPALPAPENSCASCQATPFLP